MQFSDGAFDDDVPDTPPSVIDASYFDPDASEADPQYPDHAAEAEATTSDEAEALALVTTQRVAAGDTYARVEMRATEDGKRALLAYSSQEALVAGAGPEQPWTAFPTSRLEQVRHEVGADLIVWDVSVDPQHRYGAEQDEHSSTDQETEGN